MSMTIDGVRIADMPDLGAFNSSSSLVGERAGSGRFSASAMGSYFGNSFAIKQVINVQDPAYGAKGDGTTDDTAAIQAAVAAATAQKRAVYFPGTTSFYRITSAITITGPLSVYGDPNNSTIKTTSATADLFVIAGLYVLIDGLRLGSTAARTGGSYINMPGAVGAIRVSRCYFDSAWVGVTIGSSGPSIIDIENCYFYNTRSNGIGILIQGGFEIRLRHIIMNSGASPQPAAGVQITNCGDVTMEDVNIIQHQDCLALVAGNGQEIDSFWATDCYFDTSSDTGLHAGTSGTGIIQRCRFIGCWFSSHGAQGVVVSGNTNGIEFIDCHAFNNGTGGFYFVGGTNYTLMGCQAAANGGAGCFVDTGGTNITLIGNTFGPVAGFGGNVYGIFFNGAQSGALVASGNRVAGNTTAAIVGPPRPSDSRNPNQVIVDNPGFVDRMQGSAALLAAATSVVVTHGLSGTPDLCGILLTMRSGLGAASTGGVYVSAVTATTFTISSVVAPGADLGITWQARL